VDVFNFYQEWVQSWHGMHKEPSLDQEGGFNGLRRKFGKAFWWDFFRRHLSVRNKIFIKTISGFKNIFHYRVTLEEKDFAINYVEYICDKHPVIDEALFSEESMREIKNFLTKRFYCAHFDSLPQNVIFPGDDYRKFNVANEKNSGYLKKRKGYYEYNGFKTRKYGFEYGVLGNNCGLGDVPGPALNRIAGSIVVDCGAFTGDSAFAMLPFRPEKIIALEPEEKNLISLKENIQLNGMNSVVPLMMGAGSEAMNVKFSDGGAGGKIIAEGSSDVKIDRIDTIVKTMFGGGRVGLIKMDIEGYEKNALLGAEETMKRDKPILVIALYHSGRDFFEIPHYVKSINPQYQLTIVHSNPLTPIFEEYLIAY
jgi:FkbM family methyltransferase